MSLSCFVRVAHSVLAANFSLIFASMAFRASSQALRVAAVCSSYALR